MIPPKRETEDDLLEQFERSKVSIGADTLLGVLTPLIERQVKILITKLSQAPPELGPLLDLRAKLVTVFSIKWELEQLAKGKVEAIEVLKKVVGA